MQYFYLLLPVAISAFEGILAKDYNIKVKEKNTILFSAVICFFAMMFFMFNTRGRFEFEPAAACYSLGFGLAFAIATVEGLNAIRTGPLSISSLVSSYSLLIPTFHGIIFLGEKIKPTMILGVIILLIALSMVNLNKNESLKHEKTWVIHLVAAFISNGMCSTIQKMQQIAFDGAYKNEFMIVALVFVCICLFSLGFAQKGNKGEMLKSALKFGVPKGVLNGGMNYFVMVATGLIASSILFPTLSAAGMTTTYFISRFRYKEILSKIQTFGYVLGIISVVLLNI